MTYIHRGARVNGRRLFSKYGNGSMRLLVQAYLQIEDDYMTKQNNNLRMRIYKAIQIEDDYMTQQNIK